MNLGEIRERVGRELKYAPALKSHRVDLRDVIQRVNETLGASQTWPYLRRTVPLWSFPDITVGNATAFLPVGWGPRNIEISGTGLQAAMIDALDLDEGARVQSHLLGAELDLADRSLRDQDDANWEVAPFVIEHVAPFTGVGTNARLSLDPRAEINTLTSAVGDLVLRFPRIRLPADVAAVISVRDENGYPLQALTPGYERDYLRPYSASNSGSPRWVLEDEGFQATFPWSIHPLGANPDQSPWLYDRENWPFTEEWALGATGSGGSVQGSTTYRVFVSWYYSGRFGPPSEVKEVTTTAGDAWTINLSGLPVLPTTGANIEYGRRIAVFMSKGEGAFFFRGFVGTPSATFDITTTNEEAGLASSALRLPRWDHLYPDGPYQYLRLLPRGGGSGGKGQRLQLEYQARPRMLIEDTDSPEFFHGFHNILVWMACAELVSRDTDKPFHDRCLGRARETLRQMKGRYLPGERYNGQKGMVNLGGHNGHDFFKLPLNWGG